MTLGSIYDLNSIKLKIRAKHESHLPKVHECAILLVQAAQKKISKNMEILLNMDLAKQSKAAVKVIGTIDRDVYRPAKKEFAYRRVLVSDIPSRAIIRNVLKLLVMVTDIQYIKICLKCTECKRACTSAERPDCEEGC